MVSPTDCDFISDAARHSRKAAGETSIHAHIADLLLSHQTNLMEVLFEHLPIGIAIFDRDLVVRRHNVTWAEYIDRATPTPASEAVPGRTLFEMAPDLEEQVKPVLERLLVGGTVELESVPLQKGGAVFYCDIVLSPLIEKADVIGVVGVVTDATEHTLARQELEQQLLSRARELSALHDVMAGAGASLQLETVLERSLDRVLKVMGSEVGAIHLLDETGATLHLAASQGVPPDIVAQIDSVPASSGLGGCVVERGEPLVVPNMVGSSRLLLVIPPAVAQSYLGIPLRARGRALGVLSVSGRRGQQFDEDDMSLLAAVADQVGVAVENARLYRQAEQLAVVRERERLARELHDSVTQSLYSLTLMAEASHRLVGAGDLERVEEYLGRLGEIAQQALKEMRLLVYQLRPLVLKREGLMGALQQRLDAVEKRAGVDARLLVEGMVELPAAVEEELYRIAQEALNNALKHAAAGSVAVRIRADEEQVTLEVEDDGRGFDPEAVDAEGGLGLISMQERADKLSGSLDVASTPGKGTRVSVSVEVP